MSFEMEDLWSSMKEAHYQRTINQLADKIRDSADPDEAMLAALSTVVSVSHAEAGTLWYYDRFGDGRIWPRAVSGGSPLTGVSLCPGEGIAGEVVQNGQAVIIAECQKDPRWAGKVDAKTGFQTNTMICVPLALGEKVFGCIQIVNKTDRVPFDERDLAFVAQLSEDVAAMFRERGLLAAWLTTAVPAEEESGEDGEKPRKKKEEMSFRKVMGASDYREMAALLGSLEEFKQLTAAEQEGALKAARDLWRYFGGRTNRAGRERKLAFWK